MHIRLIFAAALAGRWSRFSRRAAATPPAYAGCSSSPRRSAPTGFSQPSMKDLLLCRLLLQCRAPWAGRFFYTCESSMPRQGALVNGAILSLAVFGALFLVIGHV